MGTVYVQEYTTKNPIELIGYEAGICYGSDTSASEKNIKRGLMNLSSGHGRTMEFPQVYLTIEGYSARVIRELYTHIGGAPSRLQASTRYINYEDFEYIIPSSISSNVEARKIYKNMMLQIANSLKQLTELGIKKEDSANLLPLGMATTVVLRTNLRNLIDMSHQRLCTRAYGEYRELMKDIMRALSEYSEEWKVLIEGFFIPKCEVSGFCEEHNSCGRAPKKSDFERYLSQGKAIDELQKTVDKSIN